MRKLSPAYVATSLVIAVAGGAACAAGVVARPGTATSSQVFVSNRAALNQPSTVPATAANSTSPNTTNAFGSTSNSAPGSTTNNASSTVSASDGSRSGSNTDSSLANVPAGSSPRTSVGTTASASTTSVDGSRSGFNTDSSAANVPIGANGSGFLGASSVNSTGTTDLGTPGINAAASVNGIVSPAIINGTQSMVTADGERIDNGASAGFANAQVDQGQFNGSAGSAVTVETVRNSQSFDRAVNVVKRDRQRVGRNGQLLQSIAPRTNVDRSREMPDDGPSPALTGLNSALTRP